MKLSDIHWSFQYDGRSQTPHFGNQLIEILNRGTTPASEKKYTVLPNYWKGYKGHGGGEAPRDLAIGEVVINRKREPSKNWHYDIQFLNTTSGENLHLDFYTADDDLRTLRDTWRVTATNGAGDKYRQFTCEGHITSHGNQQQVTLVVNNTTLPVGHFENAHPITCNWTLFDIIPKLAHQLKSSGKQISDRYKYVCEYIPYGNKKDLLPPGPDPERIGLEQIFDLRNDPGETQNLAYDENKRALLMQCRQALLDFEAGLERRQITHERPTRQIDAWGQRIRAHWDAHPELEAMRIPPAN